VAAVAATPYGLGPAAGALGKRNSNTTGTLRAASLGEFQYFAARLILRWD